MHACSDDAPAADTVDGYGTAAPHRFCKGSDGDGVGIHAGVGRESAPELHTSGGWDSDETLSRKRGWQGTDDVRTLGRIPGPHGDSVGRGDSSGVGEISTQVHVRTVDDDCHHIDEVTL